MGTNYYEQTDAGGKCPCCGHEKEPLRKHIGKSSAGWTFALRVYPDENITRLQDWVERWAKNKTTLVDEYGETIPHDLMLRIITDRCGPCEWSMKDSFWFARGSAYQSEAQFHVRNRSERGPRGLLRSYVDGTHCVGHGEGTWDYVKGEFS